MIHLLVHPKGKIPDDVVAAGVHGVAEGFLIPVVLHAEGGAENLQRGIGLHVEEGVIHFGGGGAEGGAQIHAPAVEAYRTARIPEGRRAAEPHVEVPHDGHLEIEPILGESNGDGEGFLLHRAVGEIHVEHLTVVLRLHPGPADAVAGEVEGLFAMEAGFVHADGEAAFPAGKTDAQRLTFGAVFRGKAAIGGKSIHAVYLLFYPLTAPALIPNTICFWKMAYTSSVGAAVMTRPAQAAV